MARKRMHATAIVFDETGRVLMVRRDYGQYDWALPGGIADPNESIADTAVREAHEETGLYVVAERLTGIYYDPDRDTHHFAFLCRADDPGAEPQAGPLEIAACGFWPTDALPRPISDLTVLRITDALSEWHPILPIRIGPRHWLADTPA